MFWYKRHPIIMDPIQALSSALVGAILAGQQQSTSGTPPSGQAAAAATATTNATATATAINSPTNTNRSGIMYCGNYIFY